MSARLDISIADCTPLGRLELMRWGLGDDFKFRENIEEIFDFINAEECDVIPKKVIKEEKRDEAGDVIQKKEEEIKLDRLTVMKEMRLLLKQLTGLSLQDLIHEANNGILGLDPGHTELKNKIRTKIFDLPFFQRYVPEKKFDGLEELSREANKMIDKQRTNRCYKKFDHLDMLDDVKNCDDPAKLLLFAFDDRLKDPNDLEEKKYKKRLKFEALRKLLIMLDLAEAKNLKDAKVNHQSSMDDLTEFLAQKMIHRSLVDQFLIVDCDKNGNAITSRIVDSLEGEEINKVNRRIEKLAARTMVKEKDGEKVRLIYRARIKEFIDLVLKAYDSNSDIASRDVDRNGKEMTFKSREEWNHFFEEFGSQLIEDILTNTQKRIDKSEEGSKEDVESLKEAKFVRVRGPNKSDGSPGDICGMYLSRKEVENGEIICKKPSDFFANFAAKAGPQVDNEDYDKQKENIDDSIIIYQIKDTLDGGQFSGSRDVSSPDLEVLKFKMEIRGSDKERKTRHYEFQIYLPRGHANSKFSLESSWISYSIKRAIRIGRVFWPEEIYGVDHDLAQAVAFEALAIELGFVEITNEEGAVNKDSKDDKKIPVAA